MNMHGQQQLQQRSIKRSRQLSVWFTRQPGAILSLVLELPDCTRPKDRVPFTFQLVQRAARQSLYVLQAAQLLCEVQLLRLQGLHATSVALHQSIDSARGKRETILERERKVAKAKALNIFIYIVYKT